MKSLTLHLPGTYSLDASSAKFIGLGLLLLAGILAGLANGAVQIPLLGVITDSASELETVVRSKKGIPPVVVQGVSKSKTTR